MKKWREIQELEDLPATIRYQVLRCANLYAICSPTWSGCVLCPCRSVLCPCPFKTTRNERSDPSLRSLRNQDMDNIYLRDLPAYNIKWRAQRPRDLQCFLRDITGSWLAIQRNRDRETRAYGPNRLRNHASTYRERGIGKAQRYGWHKQEIQIRTIHY